MSRAIQDLKDFLTKSPSVVFPDEVLEYVDAIEAENDKLRELIADVHEALRADKAGMFHMLILVSMEGDMHDLGIEVEE